MILVDDHFIAAHLAAGGGFLPEVPRVATTCSWWWRLASAIERSGGGALSARLEESDPILRAALGHAVATLPSRLTVLDQRELIPAMAVLAAEHRLNLLAAEAVIAAEVLGADLVVGHDTPKLRTAAALRGIPYRVIT